MKKFLVSSLIAISAISAHADGRHHGGHHGHHGHHGGYSNNWIAPLIVGGIVTYALTHPQPVVIQQPQVVQPVQPIPYGYHYESILDSNCNCYRTVLVQNY